MKYLGSKNRIALKVLSAIPRDNELWVEPFIGGCGMARNVKGLRIGADSNHYMIALWKAIQSGWEPPLELSKELYYEIKVNPDDYDPALTAFAMVGCSFGGAWANGYANPVGKRNYVDESRRSCLKLKPLIQDIEFIHSNYEDLVIPDGSIIYCDPPYANTKGYKDQFDHDKFFQWCREKSATNKVYISEYQAPDDFKCILSLEKTNSFDSYKTKNTIEKLFTV